MILIKKWHLKKFLACIFFGNAGRTLNMGLVRVIKLTGCKENHLKSNIQDFPKLFIVLRKLEKFHFLNFIKFKFLCPLTLLLYCKTLHNILYFYEPWFDDVLKKLYETYLILMIHWMLESLAGVKDDIKNLFYGPKNYSIQCIVTMLDYTECF